MTPERDGQRAPSGPYGIRLRGWARWPGLPFVALGLVGAALVFHATAWGPWAFSDAAGYITAARNLIAGHGIGAFDPNGRFSPGVSHPPLYVLLLGAVSLPGLEPLEAARILDVLLFGILVAACGFMFYRLLSSLWAGIALSSLLLLHPALIVAYTSAMAEPPFILLGLLSLLLVAGALRRPRRDTILAAGLCAGGAFLSRYPGVCYVLAGSVALLLWGGPGWPARLRRAAGFSALGVLPVGIFLLWVTSLPAAEGPRALAAHVPFGPGTAQFGRSLATVLWSWKPVPPAALLPGPLRGLLIPGWLSGGLAILALLGLIWVGWRISRAQRAGGWPRQAAEPATRLLQVSGLFVVVYVLFFAAAYLFTNPTPDVDSRTLLPLLPALLVAAIALGRLGAVAWPESRMLRLGKPALLLAAVLGYAVISRDTVLGLHRTGLGYTGRAWRDSPTIAAVQRLPAGQRLISNEPAAVLLLTGRSAYVIDELNQAKPVEAFAAYGEGDTEAETAFRQRGAALVLFDSAGEQFASIYGPLGEQRLAEFVRGLIVAFQGADGAIYRSAAPLPAP